MSLATTIEQLKKTIARAEGTYAEGRARHPALAPFESPTAALAAVDRGSPLSLGQRDAVLLALIDELKHGPAQIWQSLLLVAFAPMLVRFRARLRRPDCDNLDQRVLVAFLETARGIPFRSYVQRNLRFMTRARIVAEGRRERRGGEMELFDEETFVGDMFGVHAHHRAAATELLRIIEGEAGEELCDALAGRHAAHGTMKDYVEEAYPRLTKRRQRILAARLRAGEVALLKKLRARTRRCEQRLAPAA